MDRSILEKFLRHLREPNKRKNWPDHSDISGSHTTVLEVLELDVLKMRGMHNTTSVSDPRVISTVSPLVLSLTKMLPEEVAVLEHLSKLNPYSMVVLIPSGWKYIEDTTFEAARDLYNESFFALAADIIEKRFDHIRRRVSNVKRF